MNYELQIQIQNLECSSYTCAARAQSIMGFAGSNLEFLVNFGKYFDNPAITEISTNYRSIKTIVDAGSCLIRNNHSCQLQKKTVSNLRKEELIKVLHMHACIKFITEVLQTTLARSVNK